MGGHGAAGYLPSAMRPSSRNALLVLVAAGAVALAGGLWLVIGRAAPAPAVVAGPIEPATGGREVERATEPIEREPEALAVPSIDDASLGTTVAYPLRVELELVRASLALQAADAPPVGAGATARLRGSVSHGAAGETRVEVRFVAGLNEGRVLYSDRTGAFGANDLYPGLSLVEIRGVGIPGALREVRLRADRDSQLHVPFGRPAAIHGRVRDREDKGIAAARVEVDGQQTETDEEGWFFLPRVAPGEVIAIATKEGWAGARQQLMVVAGSVLERGKFALTLEPAGRLQVTIADRINVDGEALLYVLPSSLDQERKFPWHRINPVRIFPGGTQTIEDLPESHVTLRLFHAGAVAQPRERNVSIQSGHTATVTLELEPAPIVKGVVTRDGAPVADAVVRLEVPERVAAIASSVGGDWLSIEREILPNLPSAVQQTTTNALGQFVLSANEAVSPVRYLVALSPDGKARGGAVLRGGETHVDLALEPLAAGERELVLQMEGRVQALPVEVVVDGAPREPILLPPGRDLHVGGLVAGSWKLSARWSSEVLVESQPVELTEDVSLSLTLPQGAIVGADEDERKRAGKR